MVKARNRIAMLAVIGARAEEARLRFEQEMIARKQARMQGQSNVVGRKLLSHQLVQYSATRMRRKGALTN
jgi:hypothetical protein